MVTTKTKKAKQFHLHIPEDLYNKILEAKAEQEPYTSINGFILNILNDYVQLNDLTK